MADTMFLTKVFSNIIMNALEAMANQPVKQLRIGNRLRTDEVEIWISDTGHGILPENLQRVFQPEFTTKAGRHRIGLWLCETVVKVHGGHIEVASKPGHGTVFTVVLPVGGE